jgi:DNA-binding MarR family transcriptional regulator
MPTDKPRNDFVRAKGLPFFAHLLRRLADRMIAEAGEFYAEQGISAPPRTASTLLLLKDRGPQSVTELADQLQQSHPLVITWIRQLKKLELIDQSRDPADGRRTLISLTRQGEDEARRVTIALEQLGCAYEKLLAKVGVDVFDGLWRLDEITQERNLLGMLRLAAQKQPD